MRKRSCDSLRDKGGFGAVLDNSEKEHQAFTICESEDQFRLLSEEFVREREHFDGKRQLLFPCLSCETWPNQPPSMAAAGVGVGCAIAAVAQPATLRAGAGWSWSGQNMRRRSSVRR